MALPNVYSATGQVTAWTSTGPVMQITCPASATAGASKGIEIYRVNVDQQTSTTTNAMSILLRYATAARAATSPVAVTPVPLNGAEIVAGSAAKTTASIGGTSLGSGTGATTYIQDGINVLSGYLYLPVPEERITIPAGYFFTVDFGGTVPSATYNITVIYRELP